METVFGGGSTLGFGLAGEGLEGWVLLGEGAGRGVFTLGAGVTSAASLGLGSGSCTPASSGGFATMGLGRSPEATSSAEVLDTDATEYPTIAPNIPPAMHMAPENPKRSAVNGIVERETAGDGGGSEELREIDRSPL